MTTDTTGSPAGTPLFSIIIPAYNRAKIIERTLRSVLAQSFSDFECLVIDDGSKDSAELAALVASFGDPRFKYFRQENGGASAARNTGAMVASGEYLVYLDSDDLFLPEKLRETEAVLRTTPDIGVYSRAYVDRGVGRYWLRPDRAIGEDEEMGDYLFIHNQFIPTSTLVVPREIARQVQFDADLRHVEDPDFCYRLYEAGLRFKMIETPLTLWSDVSGHARLSQEPSSNSPSVWLSKMKGRIPKRIERGYRVTILANYLAYRQPFTVMRDLLVGWMLAGVPWKIVARQAVRSFMPKPLYRRLVNSYLRQHGLVLTLLIPGIL
jgi:glycosyltransferase involved in cell wall biosynthesis